MNSTQNPTYKHTVSKDADPQRVLDYVLENLDWISSRNGLKKALKNQEFKIDGEVIEPSRIIQPGQELSYEPIIIKRTVYEFPLKVVYQDDYLAVINKPGGISVSGNYFRTIENALPYNLEKSKQKDALNYPLPVHRLDNPTGGILLVAKTKSMRIQLGELFEKKQIKKRYKAIVVGKPKDKGEVGTPIDGKLSKSVFKLLRTVESNYFGKLSLVDLEPVTGRTHQLRIHMADINCPILSDKQYGNDRTQLKGKGLFLYAYHLAFKHPFTNELMEFTLELPNKFIKLMKM